MGGLSHETLRVREQDAVCVVQLYRPDAGNTINARLVAELTKVLARCAAATKVVGSGGSGCSAQATRR